ncbi:MAG: hypothetical protein PHH47_11115 [Gallionella sp.]|nr:hypothetical protein [Gallionella sp.]MDD4946990.1 hypothetical protein [Gallionella sp.]
MNYLQAALAVSATMYCYTGYAEDDVAERQGAVLKNICQQIVRDIDRDMGQTVTSCIPAASVQHGQPDLLLVVANKHFAEEETRAKWLGLSMLAASRAVENLSAGGNLQLKTLLLDQADHQRQSLRDLKLCNLAFSEVTELAHRQGAQADPGQLYRDSSCNRPSTAMFKAESR